MNKEKNGAIVFVLPLFEEGGAEKTIAAILSGLADNGMDVHLIVMQDKVTLKIPNHVHLHILEDSFIRKIPQVIQKKILSFKLRKLVEIIEPAVVFTSLPRAHKLVARTFNNREDVYYIFHNTPSPSLSKKAFSRMLGIYKLHRLYNGKNIITLSNGIRHDILQTLDVKANEIAVINNPFEIEEIKKMAQESVDDLPSNDFVVCVSHFYKRKRHDILIKSYKASGIKALLVLLGERGEMEKVQQLVKQENLEDKVIFLGWKSNPYPYIDKAKLLVLSSDEEGMPRAVVEGLILHTPVVSTDCPSGPNEVLVGDLKHYLVPTGDVKKLAETMKDALNSYPEIMDEMTVRFSKDYVVAKYVDLIAKVKQKKQ